MTKLIRFLIAVVLFTACTLASAQSLWGGADYGMSVSQVRSAVKGAVTPDKPGHLGDGAEELLKVANVEIVNQRFDAHFYFKGQKLSQVTLSLIPEREFHGLMLVFDSLTDALRSKYGQEISRNISRGTLNRADATWMSGRTNINVFVLSVSDTSGVLNINYQVRVASDADKL
jgi:hypothetical protein